jgi:hypothetical protein
MMKTSRSLQRKCACGGGCDSCRARGNTAAPPIVHEVLRSSGRPLDAPVLAAMGPRFRADFSRVRVHDDAHAAASARAIHADAYTVGRDVVFGHGRYAPRTPAGRKLLAHELTHVVQQESSAGASGPLLVGAPDTAEEAEAHRGERPGRTASRIVQRQNHGDEGIQVELEPTPRDEQRRLHEQGIDLPEVSLETWRTLTTHVGRELEPAEKTAITQLTQAQVPSTPLALPQGPRFVLHDTAGRIESSEITRRAGLARGPLGVEGSEAYIPETGPAVNSYALFEGRRVASTQFERGTDLMRQRPREAGYRAIWRNASGAAQSAALGRALAGFPLQPNEITAEQTSARSQLNATSGEVHTTASWAAAELCTAATANPAAVAASPAQIPTLTAACNSMSAVFAARRQRTASTVNVEIVMDKGSPCDVTPGKVLPPMPSLYTENQYVNIRNVYLRAAQAAGRYPEITTHFLIDRGMRDGGHCDPRCFNLHHLYSLIATSMRHHAASEYGITPQYGTTPTSNVWWNDGACHGPHP